jgi:hypothetical protein
MRRDRSGERAHLARSALGRYRRRQRDRRCLLYLHPQSATATAPFDKIGKSSRTRVSSCRLERIYIVKSISQFSLALLSGIRPDRRLSAGQSGALSAGDQGLVVEVVCPATDRHTPEVQNFGPEGNRPPQSTHRERRRPARQTRKTIIRQGRHGAAPAPRDSPVRGDSPSGSGAVAPPDTGPRPGRRRAWCTASDTSGSR